MPNTPARLIRTAVGALAALAILGSSVGATGARVAAEARPFGEELRQAVRLRPPTPPDRVSNGGSLRPLSSPDVGEVCATDLGASGLDAVFDSPIGALTGFDYQRPLRLPDDRVLWFVQDAWIATATAPVLVHNAALVQSGRCFTPIIGGTADSPQSWILADETTPRHHWYWPFGGEADPSGELLRVFFAEMTEVGPAYLTHTFLTSVVLVEIELPSLEVRNVRPAPDPSTSGYGFSVTSDAEFTYLYSSCFLQFGHGPFGAAPCTSSSKLARVPRGRLDLPPVYWNGVAWVADTAVAADVIDPTTTGHPTNPAQVRFSAGEFQLIEKEGDWWGTQVVVQSSPHAYGPWTTTSAVTAPLRCGDCNSYFATWVPWRTPDGAELWSLSNNRWSGEASPDYRPTFFTT